VNAWKVNALKKEFSEKDGGLSNKLLVKGIPVERQGRKATGLRDWTPTTAGLPMRKKN